MNDKILFPGLAVAALAVAMFAAPLLASAVEDYLTIEKAEVKHNSFLKVEVDTAGAIPTAGAFGYGAITDSGDVIVATTHGVGVLDSEDQVDGFDPVWHNHYVTLGMGNADCVSDVNPDGLHVVDITLESPGQVEINGNNAELKNVPAEVDGTDARTSEDLPINAGTPVAVASFTLSVPNYPSLDAVCVDNVTVAAEEDLEIKEG